MLTQQGQEAQTLHDTVIGGSTLVFQAFDTIHGRSAIIDVLDVATAKGLCL